MNVQALLKQAQKMQADLAKIEKELEERIYTEENDFVRVECNGRNHVNKIEFKEQGLNDIEMLQDMTAVAINKALEAAKEDHDKEMAKITGGVKMPGVF